MRLLMTGRTTSSLRWILLSCVLGSLLLVKCSTDGIISKGKAPGPTNPPANPNETKEQVGDAGGDGLGTGPVIGNVSAEDCVLGYPFPSSNPRTDVVFNENDVLVPYSGSLRANGTLKIFYTDEHALALGVRSVAVITAAGSTTTSYNVSQLPSSPGIISSPQVGSLSLSGDQAGIDTNACSDPAGCGRPIYPALFITDMTQDPASKAGDWQYHGTGSPPDAVLGTWKAAARTVDHVTGTVKVMLDPDPAENGSNIGNGEILPPGVGSEGFSSEVHWKVSNLGLAPGHIYRAQFMVHDGDQNKSGGDVGQGCVIIRMQ